MWHGNKLQAMALTGAMLVLSACGGGGDAAPSASSSTPSSAASTYGVTQTNQQIAALIYSDSTRTPSGFYSESLPVFDGYVATRHINTQDINPNAVLRYELCTNDYNQALDWSNMADALSGDNAAIVSTDITDRYFEFDRLRLGTPNGYLRERVYKCSYLSRTTVDLTATSGDAGILNARPIDAAALETLSEYLWQFTAYNNYGNVVLVSSGDTVNNTLTHTLVIAQLSHGSGNSCDTIALVAWRHSVDVVTGDLDLSVTPLVSFAAQEVSGNVVLCNN